MIRSRNKFFSSGRYKSSSLLTLNEIDEIEKKFDWRKNYLVNPKEIGRGHFSKVYQITCENRKQLLAAKIVRRRKGGIDRLEKIRKEAEIIRRLNEKNIISVIQLFETHENFSEVVLISEFAKGGSLFNLVQDFNNGLDQNYVKCVIFKLLKALESMHLDNIVHLDIKADNILLRELYPSSNIAICDFGLATELKKGINYKELVGTPDYMAPEIINYEKITFNADMWSVGVLIYFLLSGISPFMGPSKDETLMNVSRVRIPFDSVFNDSEYSDAKSLISLLCVKSPNLRLSSSVAQNHSWFENIPTLNLDYPLVDTKIEFIPTKPSTLNQSISVKLKNSDIESQSNDNLNNYNLDELINIQRCQSADFDCINFDSKYKLLNTQHHSLISALSYDNIFTNENDNDKDAIDYGSSTEEITNNNHTSLNKRKSLHQLSLVDEVADEMSYDCNGDIDLNKGVLNYGKMETEDLNIQIQNKEIEENSNMLEKSYLSKKLVSQVTNKLSELSENSCKINERNTKSDLVEKETVDFSKCKESENDEFSKCKESENDEFSKCEESENIEFSKCVESENIDISKCRESENDEFSKCKESENDEFSKCEESEIIEFSKCGESENIEFSKCVESENDISKCVESENDKFSKCKESENGEFSKCVESENDEFSKCEESENIECQFDTDDKLKLSQIQISITPDFEQAVNDKKNENSTILSNSNFQNKDLYAVPLDEYVNISDNCDEKCQHNKKEPRYSSSSDMDEEDDYRYTSLLPHFRFSEICKFL